MKEHSSEPDWLFFAYRSCSSRFQIRALGRSDREPNSSGFVASTGQRVKWKYPLEFVSRAETGTEQRTRWARSAAFGFQDCDFDASIAENEILIAPSERQHFVHVSACGTFSSVSITQLAPYLFGLLMQQIDFELRKFIADIRCDAPFEELITSRHEIEFAEGLRIEAGDYLTIVAGQDGPFACLKIRNILPNGQFEGELFTTSSIGGGVNDIYSVETGRINGISTQISCRIGQIELAPAPLNGMDGHV